jgi:hypothetical protein
LDLWRQIDDTFCRNNAIPPPGFSADVPLPQRLKPCFVNLAGIFMISVLVVGFNAPIELSIETIVKLSRLNPSGLFLMKRLFYRFLKIKWVNFRLF